MAYWAEVDKNNIVIRVLIMDNNDPNGDEGYQWLVDNLGGTWLQTSYNSIEGVHYLPDTELDQDGKRLPSGKPHLRYNFAGVGMAYDKELDGFIRPKPEKGQWVFNRQTCSWDGVVPD